MAPEPKRRFTGNDAFTKGGPLEGVDVFPSPKPIPEPKTRYVGNDFYVKGGDLKRPDWFKRLVERLTRREK